MLINPSYEELYNVQEHGIKPNAYNPGDYLRMVSKVFSTFGDKNVYQNTNSYINGFVVDYSYQFLEDDTLTADELNSYNLQTNNKKHHFVIHPGNCIVDNQLITFKEKLYYSFSETYFMDTQYSIIISYKWLDQYHEEYAKVLFVPTNNLVDLNDNANIDKYQYIVIGTFDVKDHNPISLEKTQINQDQYNLKSANDKNLYFFNSDNDLYSPRGLNPQHLNDKYMANYKSLFDNLKDNFKLIVTDLGLTESNYTIVPSSQINNSLLSSSFVKFNYSTHKYEKCDFNINNDISIFGLYLYNKVNEKHYIFTSGTVTIDPEIYEINNPLLTNLIPGNYYYLNNNIKVDNIVIEDYTNANLDGNEFILSSKHSSGAIRVGYAIDKNKLDIRIDQSKDLNTLEITTLMGNAKDFKDIFDAILNSDLKNTEVLIKEKDLLLKELKDLDSKQFISTNTNSDIQLTNLITFLDGLDFTSYSNFTKNNTTEQQNVFYMTLYLLYYQLRAGLTKGQISNIFKYSFFDQTNPNNILGDIDADKLGLNISNFSNILNNTNNTSSNIDETVNLLLQNSKIINVSSTDEFIYENIKITGNDDTSIDTGIINGNFYYTTEENQTNTKGIFKIVLSRPVSSDVKFVINDSSIGYILVPSGSNVGSATKVLKKNDIYKNDTNMDIKIIDIIGADSSNIILDNRAIFNTIPEFVDITNLDIQSSYEKKIVTHKLNISVNKIIEDSRISGTIKLIDHNGYPIMVKDILGTELDKETQTLGSIYVTMHCDLINESIQVKLDYNKLFVDFEFNNTLMNDIYKDIDYCNISILNISGFGFEKIYDTSAPKIIQVKVQDKIDKTLLVQELYEAPDKSTHTLYFSLNQIPNADINIYLNDGNHVVIPKNSPVGTKSEIVYDGAINSSAAIINNKFKVIDSNASLISSTFEDISPICTSVVNALNLPNTVTLQYMDSLESGGNKVTFISNYYTDSELLINVDYFDVSNNGQVYSGVVIIPPYEKQVTLNLSDIFRDIIINDDVYINPQIGSINITSIDSAMNGGFNNNIIKNIDKKINILDNNTATYAYMTVQLTSDNKYLNLDFNFTEELKVDYIVSLNNGTQLDLDAGDNKFKRTINISDVISISDTEFINEVDAYNSNKITYQQTVGLKEIDNLKILNILPKYSNVTKNTFENLKIVNSYLDIPLKISNPSIIGDNNTNFNISKSVFVYENNNTIKLSNKPQTDFVITFTNLNKTEFITKTIYPINSTPSVNFIRTGYKLLEELFIYDITGGNFEFLNINNNDVKTTSDLNNLDNLENFNITNPSAYLNTDANSLGNVYLTCRSNNKISEDSSIEYTFKLDKKLPSDITIYLKNGELARIPSGSLETSIKSKKIDLINSFSDDNIKDSKIVENYITKITGNNYVNIIVLNDKDNPMYTTILDTIDSVNIKLESAKDATSTDKIIYTVTLSEAAKCDLNILLNNGTTIVLLKGQSTISKPIFLNEHNILSLSTLFNINFDSVFKSPNNLYNLTLNIMPKLSTIIDNYTLELDNVMDTDVYLNDLNKSISDYMTNIYTDTNITNNTISTINFENINNQITLIDNYYTDRINYQKMYKVFENSIGMMENIITYNKNLYGGINAKITELTNKINILNINRTEFINNLEVDLLNQVTKGSMDANTTNTTNDATISEFDYIEYMYKLDDFKRRNYNYNYLITKILFYINKLIILNTELEDLNKNIVLSFGNNKLLLQNKKNILMDEISSYDNIIKNNIDEFNYYAFIKGKTAINYNDVITNLTPSYYNQLMEDYYEY